MKPTEAAALLTIAAAYDNRRPDPDAAKAWAMALADVRFEDAREAIVNHYRTTTDWLMPKHVVDGVKKIRRNRVLAFGVLPDPPHGIDPDTNAYRQWLAATTKAIADGEPLTPAAAIEPAPMPPELARRMRALGMTTTTPETKETR